MTTLAPHITERDEIEAEIAWFEDLLEIVRDGNVEDAECMIWAAMHRLEKRLKENT